MRRQTHDVGAKVLVALALALAPAIVSAEEPPPEEAARATVRHVPPSEAGVGEPLRLVAQVDEAWTEARLVARHRQAGTGGPFREITFERSSVGGYYATIPASDLR